VSYDVTTLVRSCGDCGLPRDSSPESIAADTPCPYCGHPQTVEASRSADDTVDQLQRAFDRMPQVSLQRLKTWLRATGEAPISYGLTLTSAPASRPLVAWIEQHDDEDSVVVKTTLSIIADALLSLYVISEEAAPADQLRDVVAAVVSGRLDQLPLPPHGPCFCGDGKRYHECHGRAAR
jgi:hypothetical protein